MILFILDHLHTAYCGNIIKKEYNLPIGLREYDLENIIMKRFYKNQKIYLLDFMHIYSLISFINMKLEFVKYLIVVL